MNESTKQQTRLRFDELEHMNHDQVPFTRERAVTYRYTGPKWMDAGCKYVTHGPNPLSKLIASLCVQKRKTPNKKTKQTRSKRKESTVFVDITNKTLARTPPATVRRSSRKRKYQDVLYRRAVGK